MSTAASGTPDIRAISHPLRAALSEEMHVRRLPRFAAPCRLVQIVTLLGEAGGAAARAHLDAIAARYGVTVPDGVKYAVLPLGDATLVWERHTEFASYTLIGPMAFAVPFDPDAFGDTGRMLIEALPGEVIRATQIAMLPSDAPPPDDSLLKDNFATEGLIVCEVAHGKACIWSDFRLNPDGYGRLLIADRNLDGDEGAQLVQRLQELGNYRNMALLGLPLAQATTPEVSRLESRLAALTQDVSERVTDDDTLLDELTFLSAELARIVAQTRYRMSATRAYAQLSAERLASLDIGRVAGFQTLADFTERRLMPAVRTCESFSQRLEDLSQRAAWTSSLLRTRVDTALARQNRDLLASMNRRTQLQLRLQQAVEGLSVVAISYYLVALLAYVIKAVPGIRHEWAIALSVPGVAVIVAVVVRTLRKRIRE